MSIFNFKESLAELAYDYLHSKKIIHKHKKLNIITSDLSNLSFRYLNVTYSNISIKKPVEAREKIYSNYGESDINQEIAEELTIEDSKSCTIKKGFSLNSDTDMKIKIPLALDAGIKIDINAAINKTTTQTEQVTRKLAEKQTFIIPGKTKTIYRLVTEKCECSQLFKVNLEISGHITFTYTLENYHFIGHAKPLKKIINVNVVELLKNNKKFEINSEKNTAIYIVEGFFEASQCLKQYIYKEEVPNSNAQFFKSPKQQIEIMQQPKVSIETLLDLQTGNCLTDKKLTALEYNAPEYTLAPSLIK